MTDQILETKTEEDRRFHTLKQLQQEWVRLKTFVGWPSKNVHPRDLAKSGFYSLKYKDHAMCFFCRGIVGFWDKGDTPSDEHKRRYPTCPYVRGIPCGNVPDDGSPLSTTLKSYTKYKLANHKPPLPLPQADYDETDCWTSSRLIPTGSSPPHYSSYVTKQSRQDTFDASKRRNVWRCSNVFPDALQMGQAGFLYSGVSDIALCFHCGGGINNWSPDEDPWEVHTRYYPFCPYLRLHKDDAYIDKHKAEVPPPTRGTKLTPRETACLLEAPVAKALLETGLSTGDVRAAFADCLEQRAFLPVNVNEGYDFVVKWQSANTPQQMDTDTSSPAAQISTRWLNTPLAISRVQTNNNIRNIASNSHGTGFVSPESRIEPAAHLLTGQFQQSPSLSASQKTPTIKRVDAATYFSLTENVSFLRLAVEDEQRRLLCRRCCGVEATILTLPCQHLHLCDICFMHSWSCPTCNRVINGCAKPIRG